MGIYNRFILPGVIELAMRQKSFAQFRKRAAGAERVLEIGIGSGLNVTYYRLHTEAVYGLDPSPQLLAKASHRVDIATVSVKLVQASSLQLPFNDRSFDTVVMTFTHCSIGDIAPAVREMRRVLRPDGELLFVEHGQAPDSSVVYWQNLLTAVRKRLGAGCHLNRKIDDLISAEAVRVHL
jgi:ubiquinone/menaquinone biosynthesis C-methylase UbiE